MKRVLTALISLLIIFSPSGATGQKQEKIFASYSLSDLKDDLHLIKEIKTGEELLPGNYSIKATLSLKSKRKVVISKSLFFKPAEGNRSSNEQLQQGWTSLDKTYYWNPDSGENVLTIPLLAPTDKITPITFFDELHLDYNDLISENVSLLSIKMRMSWEKSGENQGTVIIDGKQLVLIKSLILPSTLWEKKGFSYLIKRTFELAHDSSWNYIRRNKSIFYHNRFHFDINAVETIDIHFKANASLEKISSLTCNLRIGFESLLIPTKNVMCIEFPKKVFRTEGNPVLRIWVGDLLRSKFIKKEKAFLDEIIFMIPQKTLKNIQEQPVAAIKFRSLHQTKLPIKDTSKKDSNYLKIKDTLLHFQTPIITLSSKRKRLIFPLEKLKDKIGKNGTIKSIALSIQPKNLDSPAEFSLQQFRLVSNKSKERPAILDLGKKLSARWGGPFFDLKENDEKIEWIKVQNFFSFITPNINPKRKLTTSLKDEKRGSKLNFTPNPIKFKGIQIHAQNGLFGWHADKSGLKLEGEGNWVEVDWPIQTKIDKNTRFFMSFGVGKENISDLKIKPFTESRKLAPISILPNKPERLNWKSEKIKRLKIKIFLHSSPFRLQLKEMTIFQPILVKPPGILDIPTLFEEETLLIPQKIQTISGEGVTLFKSHLSAPLWTQKGVSSELSWTTKVNKKVNRIQGLKVMYKVPPTMHVNNPCWLNFTLVSTIHTINRTMCSEDSTNEIIFPAENLFHGSNFQNNEILKHISWKVLAKNPLNVKNQPLPLDVAVSIIGYDIRTFRKDLLSRPIMEWNGTALFPTSLDGVSTDDIFPHKFSTSLGSMSIKSKSEAHPFFVKYIQSSTEMGFCFLKPIASI